MRNRAGWYRKNLSSEAEYISFVPYKLPPEPGIVIDNELMELVFRFETAIVECYAFFRDNSI